MSDEDAFQAALDANRHDTELRGVLGDWLMDQGDVRAEGYQAIAVQSRKPLGGSEQSWYPELPTTVEYQCDLPQDWFDLIEGGRIEMLDKTVVHRKDFDTRREAEDAATLAFAKLPETRRAELLAPITEGAAA